jgi:hypothetical protein
VNSPIVVAILVFLSIYLIFLLIRLFADMFIVGIALASGVLAYQIKGHYPEFVSLLQDSPIVNLVGANLPAQSTSWSIFLIASIITLGAVLLCLPFLPFSATYRFMLGIEKPLFSEEAKIRGWIREELEHNRLDSERAEENE